jgi:hypothetical protein
VQGTANGAEGRVIKISTVTDYITYTPLYLACDTINGDGSFFLNFDITHSYSVKVEIDYYSTFIYVRPGRNISVDFLSFDYRLAERMNVFIETTQLSPLQYAFSVSDSDSIFMIANIDSGYILQMNRYRAARYAEATGKMNRKKLFENYIDNVPFSLNNEYFIEFVGDFFNNYFSRFSNKFLWQFFSRVNEDNASSAVDNLLDTMGIDPFMRNEMLREYIFIKGLYQYANSLPFRWEQKTKDIVRERVRLLLEALSGKTKFTEFAKIINQILSDWDNVKSFASMVLKDFSGQTVRFDSLLNNFSARYLYVGFVSSNQLLCPDCVSETDVLLRLRSTDRNFRDKVQIILINVDDEFMTYHRHYRNQKYVVPYLYFNRQISFMRELDAVHFPCYFLLDNTGTVIESDFAKPSDGLAKKLSTIISENPEH